MTTIEVTVTLYVEAEDETTAELCAHSALSNLIDAGDIVDFTVDSSKESQ